MAEKCFHPSVEGAQHGAKSLVDFLDYAKRSGATGVQPSNYMLQAEKRFKSVQEIKDAFEKAGQLREVGPVGADCVRGTPWCKAVEKLLDQLVEHELETHVPLWMNLTTTGWL